MNRFESIDRLGTYSVKYDSIERIFGSQDVLPMWVADMDIASPQSILEAISKRAKHPIYGYTAYPKEFFEAIKKWYKREYECHISDEWIVPCSGVVNSIICAIEAYTKENDGIIVQTPVYTPFFKLVEYHNRILLENRLIYHDGKYEIDFENFEELAKKAKLFLLCSPHNPISKVWSKDELEKLMDICKKYDVIVVSDEVHCDLVYEKKFVSFSKLNYDNAVILNSPSKSFNVAGLKTSYAIIENKILRSKYKNIQQKNGHESGNPFGIAALIGAYNGSDEWLQSLRVHLINNIKLINDMLKAHKIPIYPVKTEATYLMWLDCRNLYEKQDKIKKFIYEKARLGLSDGNTFGNGGDGFMRLNFGTSSASIKQAMNQLIEAYNIEFNK